MCVCERDREVEDARPQELAVSSALVAFNGVLAAQLRESRPAWLTVQWAITSTDSWTV